MIVNELITNKMQYRLKIIDNMKPVSRIERNAATLKAFYDHGYQLMEREYDRLIKYLEV